MIKQCKYVLYNIYNTYSKSYLRRPYTVLHSKYLHITHSTMNTSNNTHLSPDILISEVKDIILNENYTKDDIQNFITEMKTQLDNLALHLVSSTNTLPSSIIDSHQGHMGDGGDGGDDDTDCDDYTPLTNTEKSHVIELLSQQLCEWLQDNMHIYVKMNFIDILHDTVRDFVEDIVSCLQIEEKYVDDVCDEIRELAGHIVDSCVGGPILPRSYRNTFITQTIPSSTRNALDNIRIKLERIDELNKSVPEQRTMEWYMYRHNLLSASNIHDAFNSTATRNRIIFDKCSPLDLNKHSSRAGSLHSPFEKGTRYEPVSQSYYELVYGTQISEYGCLPHTKYPFIGASPDGINTDKSSPLYGRMLEIKNVVSREITGIPKEDYWVQMQIQMETCDLDECDFLECNFKEYDNYNDFIEDSYDESSIDENDISMNVSYKNTDTKSSFTHTRNGELKGVILCFINDNKYHYEYKPILMDENEYEEWEQNIMDKNCASGMKWIHTFYWRLQYVSCVLVPRNKPWFMSVIDKIKDTWETIEKERITGYQHRAPKRRSPFNTTTQTNKKTPNVIKLDTEITSTETHTDTDTVDINQNEVIDFHGGNDIGSGDSNGNNVEIKEIVPTPTPTPTPKPSPQLKPSTSKQNKFSGLFLKIDT